jgi:hypothetical protein
MMVSHLTVVLLCKRPLHKLCGIDNASHTTYMTVHRHSNPVHRCSAASGSEGSGTTVSFCHLTCLKIAVDNKSKVKLA